MCEVFPPSLSLSIPLSFSVSFLVPAGYTVAKSPSSHPGHEAHSPEPVVWSESRNIVEMRMGLQIGPPHSAGRDIHHGGRSWIASTASHVVLSARESRGVCVPSHISVATYATFQVL